jgi:hypothetical protein
MRDEFMFPPFSPNSISGCIAKHRDKKDKKYPGYSIGTMPKECNVGNEKAHIDYPKE